jgi:hypothetical protein
VHKSAFGTPYPEDLLLTKADMASTKHRRDHSGVDIIAERAIEYVSPNENSNPQLSAITTGKRTVRSPRFCDWGAWPMTVGRFKAHVSSRISARANDFTFGAGNRAPAQRHHNRNRTSETQAPNGIRSLASAHDE